MKKLSFTILAIILAGCSNNQDPVQPDPEAPISTSLVTSDASNLGVEFGIGDVEAQFWWSLRLKKDSIPPNITNNEFKSKREIYTKVEITAEEPYPDSLIFDSYSRHLENFPGQAVIVDLHIFMNDQEIESVSYITGENAMREPNVTSFDIMKHIDPENTDPVLIRGTADMYWFKDTDESTLTLDTPRDDPRALSAQKMSNIVKIEFK